MKSGSGIVRFFLAVGFCLAFGVQTVGAAGKDDQQKEGLRQQPASISSMKPATKQQTAGPKQQNYGQKEAGVIRSNAYVPAGFPAGTRTQPDASNEGKGGIVAASASASPLQTGLLAAFAILNTVLLGGIIFLFVKRGRSSIPPAYLSMMGDKKNVQYAFRKAMLVGRSSMQLNDESISDRHFLVRKKGDRYIIRDLGSRNGTFVNRQRISAGILNDGDVIEAGGTVFIFGIDHGPGHYTLN